MTKLAAILPIAAACVAAGCAQTAAGPAHPQSSARQCFLAREVNSFGAVNDQVIDVSVGASRYFRLQLAGGCPNIDWSRRLALRTTTGTSWICEGLDAEVFSLDGPFPQRCLVDSVTPISKQQYLATRHR